MSSIMQSLMGSASASPSPADQPTDITPQQGPQNPFADIGAKIQGGKYQQGTMLNFIQQLMGGRKMANTGGIPRTDELTGTPSSDSMSPTPSAEQQQQGLQAKPTPTPAPISKYAVPNIIHPDAIGAVRNTILTAKGLNPEQYTPDPTSADKTENAIDPNSLAGRMSGPNSKADMRSQAAESEAISTFIGRKKTSGTIKAQPQKTSQAQQPNGNVQVAGDYRGQPQPGTEEYKNWDAPGTGWTKAVALPKGMTPEEYLKSLPDDVEGVSSSGSNLIFLRKKSTSDGDNVPMSSNNRSMIG